MGHNPRHVSREVDEICSGRLTGADVISAVPSGSMHSGLHCLQHRLFYLKSTTQRGRAVRKSASFVRMQAMPAHISACFVPVVHFACFCMLCADMHSLRCILSLCLSHHVIRDVSHATLLVEPDFGHTCVEPGCMLNCIYIHKSLHAFGSCHYCPRHYGIAQKNAAFLC